MKKNIKFNEELIEQFDAQEMVMLTGGKWGKILSTILDILGLGDIHGNCSETNGENCECSY